MTVSKLIPVLLSTMIITWAPPMLSQGVLTGRLTNATTQQPLPNSTVQIVGTQRFTRTNEDGRYTLVGVPAGTYQVRATRLGYGADTQPATVADGQTTTLDFVLTQAATRLQEIVTTVTGPQRRIELGNTIGTINADSVVREAPITSLSDLVNARVPGVQVVTNNGATGSSPRVRIRGVHSLSATNAPLLVVDGIRVDNSSGGIPDNFGRTSGRFNDLNPEEIESIEIIKGPSAATLYGTDAANGVIVVQTKRGRAGAARWNVYTEAGRITQPTEFRENYFSWGHTAAAPSVARQCLPLQALAATCIIDSLTHFQPLNNSETTVFGTGSRQQHGLQVSGGVSQFTYFLGGEFEQETGPLELPGFERDRISALRGGVELPEEQLRPQALRKLSLRNNTGIVLSSTADVNLSLGYISSAIRSLTPSSLQTAYLGNGYRDARNGYSLNGPLPGEDFGKRNTENVAHVMGSLRGNWRPITWLTTHGTVGLDRNEVFIDALQRAGEGGSAAGARFNVRTGTTLTSADLGASVLFTPRRQLTSRTSVGVQYNRTEIRGASARGRTLLPGSETVASAAVPTSAEVNIETVVAGGYVEQTVGFAERLFVTGALRGDGASAFGQDFSTVVYPKASVSWVAAQPRPGMLNSFRLRAAYGASGVQPGPTDALALAAFSPTVVNGVATTGAVVSTLGNPGLKPERQTELETGFDVELLHNRLRLEATYYNQLSRDALINRPLPTETGFATQRENIGAVRNRGFEGLLSATVLDMPALTWDLSLNGSVNRNRVEALGLGPTGVVNPGGSFETRVGYPIGSRFGNALVSYADANGNGLIESSEVVTGPAGEYLGTSHPPRQFTLGSSISLLSGQLRISTQFDRRSGHTIFNVTDFLRNLFLNSRAANDPATPLDEQAANVCGCLGGAFEDASFVRWRELSVTYTLPDALTRSMRTRAASLTLTGRNLRLFSNYRGPDPEINDGVQFFPEGFSDNGLVAPPTRNWIIRLNLGL